MMSKPATWATNGVAAFVTGKTNGLSRRVHWYAEGAEESACANYRRPFVTYHPHATEAEPCIRCVETFTFAGLDVPPYQVPTPPEPVVDEDEEDAR
jgi:hypothetical protein